MLIKLSYLCLLPTQKVDFFVLDKLLINNIYKNIHTLIVFNKIDEASEEDIENIKQVYSNSGYPTFYKC